MSSLPDPLKLGFSSLHVSSSAFLDAYPQNVMSNFKFKTSIPLPIKGDWTMALHSIEYTNMIVNVEPSIGAEYENQVRALENDPSFHRTSLTYFLRRYTGDQDLFYIPISRPISLDCHIDRASNIDNIKSAIENGIASQQVLKGVKYYWFKHKIELTWYDAAGAVVKTLYVRGTNAKLSITSESFENIFKKLAALINTTSKQNVALVEENNALKLTWDYPNIRQCKWKIFSPGHYLAYKLGIEPSTSSSYLTSGESEIAPNDIQSMVLCTRPPTSILPTQEENNTYSVNAYENASRTGKSITHTFSVSQDYFTQLTDKNGLRDLIQGDIEGFSVEYNAVDGKWVFSLQTSSPWEVIDVLHSNPIDTPIQGCFRSLIGVSKEELPFHVTKAAPFSPTYEADFNIILDNVSQKYISLSELVKVEKASDSTLQFIWNNKEYTHGYTDLTLSFKHHYGQEEKVIKNVLIGNNTKIENYTHSWMTTSSQTNAQKYPRTFNAELPIVAQPHLESSHPDLFLSQDTILVEMGYKVSDTRAKVVVSCRRKLHAPGCYSSFDIVKKAFFETFSSMVYSVNGEHIDLETWVEMEKKDYTNQCMFKLKATSENRYVGIHLNPHLARLLGFREPQSEESKPYLIEMVSNVEKLLPLPFSNDPYVLDLDKPIDIEIIQMKHRANYMLNLHDGVTLMYIYMPNLLEKISVGESHLPLLATCPIEGKTGERVIREVINPDKRRLTQDILSECEIQLLDYQGRRIKFYTGINPVNINLRIEAVQAISTE